MFLFILACVLLLLFVCLQLFYYLCFGGFRGLFRSKFTIVNVLDMWLCIRGYELHSREESWPPAERRRQTVGQWAREGERWRRVTVAVSSVGACARLAGGVRAVHSPTGARDGQGINIHTHRQQLLGLEKHCIIVCLEFWGGGSTDVTESSVV